MLRGPLLSLCFAVGAISMAASPGVAAPTAPPVPKTVLVGADDNLAPFESLDASGNPQGFDIELIKEIAAAGGIGEVKFRVTDSGGATADLETGGVDLGFLAYSDARAQRYDFLVQVWTLDQVIAFAPGRTAFPTSTDRLGPETVAVSRVSPMYDLLRGLPESQRPLLIEVTDSGSAIPDLLSGKITGVAGNSLTLQGRAAEKGLGPLPMTPIKAFGYWIATANGKRSQFAWVVSGLQKLKESGRFDRLVERHLMTPTPRSAEARPPAPSSQSRRFGQYTAMVLLGAAVLWGGFLLRRNWLLTRRLQSGETEIESMRERQHREREARDQERI